MTTLQVRRVRFEYPDGMNPCWMPSFPEFACAANAVSLLMPYAEPLFIKAVRSALPKLDDDLRRQTEAYIKQETGHYTQHRRLNDLVEQRYPATARLQSWMRRCADWIWTTRSRRFNLAFAAGGETISYGVARWTEKHLGQLFDGAEPLPTTLFLWHLAEEVEHKSATYDVFDAVDGSRLRYALALTTGCILIGWFTFLGTMMMLWKDRRLFLPVTWYRLTRWSISLAFELFPTMLISALPRHHPRDFSDPVFLPEWLALYDPDTATMPVWDTGVAAA